MKTTTWSPLLLALSACVHPAQQRAAHDFNCPVDRVSVKPIGAGGWRAEGCSREATYVCQNNICVRDSEVSGGADPEPQSPPVVAGPQTVEVSGLRFELPAGFTKGGSAYSDEGHRHVVTARVVKTKGDEADWINVNYPDAESWKKTVDGRPLTFVRVAGYSSTKTVVVTVVDDRAYELTCTNPATKPAKTDGLCTRILLTYQLVEEPSVDAEQPSQPKKKKSSEGTY